MKVFKLILLMLIVVSTGYSSDKITTIICDNSFDEVNIVRQDVIVIIKNKTVKVICNETENHFDILSQELTEVNGNKVTNLDLHDGKNNYLIYSIDEKNKTLTIVIDSVTPLHPLITHKIKSIKRSNRS